MEATTHNMTLGMEGRVFLLCQSNCIMCGQYNIIIEDLVIAATQCPGRTGG